MNTSYLLSSFPRDVLSYPMYTVAKVCNYVLKNLYKIFSILLKMALANRGTKRSKWALDFTSMSKYEDVHEDPPGYEFSPALSDSEFTKEEYDKLIVKKAWNVALAPLKQLPMNLIMMYMSGNSISIFPIMMVGMMLFRPIKAFADVHTTFSTMEGSQTIAQKFVYFIGNLMGLGIALYKCHTMKLLPIWPSDWLEFQEPQQQMEFSGGGLLL